MEMKEIADGTVLVEVRVPFDEMLALGVPTGLPSSPCTATLSLPAEFDARMALVAAVAQEAGLDLGDFGRVAVTLDGGTVVFAFPSRG